MLFFFSFREDRPPQFLPDELRGRGRGGYHADKVRGCISPFFPPLISAPATVGMRA